MVIAVPFRSGRLQIMIKKDRGHLRIGKEAKNTMLFVLCFKAEFYMQWLHFSHLVIIVGFSVPVRSVPFSLVPFQIMI